MKVGMSCPYKLCEIVTEDADKGLIVMENYDVVIVGGGILGLATARELLTQHKDLRVVILEKEAELSTHQTGHNSGVIHSGIYYKPGSLKAKVCVAGHRAMIDFCDAHDIPYRLCGKV